MVKVITPNIFITNNYDTIKKFFIDSYGSLTEIPENDTSSLLISPKNNQYLESFEYSVNYDKPDLITLSITLIDIDNTLENKIFINSQDHLTAQAVKAITDDPASIRQLYKAVEILDGQHILYVSFGVGYDITNWSDPRAFYIYKVVLDVTNTGVRKYKLVLYPSNNVLFKPRLRYNFQKPNQDREFLFTRNSSNIFAFTPKIKNESEGLILYKLLKNYIRIICNVDESSIIGIMPDISVSGGKPRFGNLEGQSLDAFKQTFGISIKTTEDAKLGLMEILTQPMPGITPMNTQQAEQETSSRFQKNVSGSWAIQSTKVQNGVNPELPDWFAPINKINTGLKSILSESSLPDDLVVTEENNLKLIKLWADFGLIPSATPLPRRVIIFGLELMIDQYLYNNTKTGNSQQTINNFFNNSEASDKSLKIVEGTTEGKLEVEKTKYSKKYLQLMSKGKISSDFGETLAIDELALSNESNSGLGFLQNINEIKNVLENFDIPVFTNNIKNSNILQLSMDNSDQYFAGLNIGIRQNAIKFYFDALQNNLESLNLGNVQLSSVFDEYSKLLLELLPLIGEDSSIAFDQLQKVIKEIISDQFRFIPKYIPPGRFEAKSYERKLETLADEEAYQIFAEQEDRKNKTQFADKKLKIFIAIKKMGLIDQFGKLILESNGDLDYKKLLFALSQRRLTIKNLTHRPNHSFEWFSDQIKYYEDSKYPERITDSKYAPIKEEYDWYIDRASLERQQANFEYANIMFALYKPELSTKRSSNIKSYSTELRRLYFNFTPRNFDLSQDAILAEIAKYTANQTYKLTLKTLPFFHIDSARSYLFKPCLVISKRLKGMGINSNPNISQFDFFTGAYNIYGFKHVITPNDCYSLFALTKKVGATIGL